MKNIVICCDGTWNRFDRDKATNVVKLCYCLTHHDPQQVMYYDPGVGTVAASRFRTWPGQAYSKLIGGAFGFGIAHDIQEAYRFLMTHYTLGDQIFLFGFSRGAYAVRALAAILKLFGLLERGNDNLFPYIQEIALSRPEGEPDFKLMARFQHHFARPVEVHFLGVWDTVSSVGWITTPVSLPHTSRNDIVEIVRHAVSIDEMRKNFRHNLFAPVDRQDLKEVWFAGAHGDVGGGWPEAESGLSKLSLAWMLREAEAAGMQVDAQRKERMLGAGGHYCAPDATAALHDPSTLMWRLAQWAPRRTFRMESDSPQAYWDWSPVLRPRFMPAHAVLHQSVVARIEADIGYQPASIGDLATHPVEP